MASRAVAIRNLGRSWSGGCLRTRCFGDSWWARTRTRGHTRNSGLWIWFGRSRKPVWLPTMRQSRTRHDGTRKLLRCHLRSLCQLLQTRKRLEDPACGLGDVGANFQHVRRPCRQARRHSVTQRGDKSLQRNRMRLRMVLGNPRVLEVGGSSAPAIPCGCNNWSSIHTHFTSICHRSVVS